MSLNLTAAYLEARHNPAALHFSASLGTASAFLAGPGGVAGDGVPAGFAGRLRGLQLWDGSTLHTVSGEIELAADDRISVFATWDGPNNQYAIAVLKNFTSTPLSVEGVPANATVQATVQLTLKEAA